MAEVIFYSHMPEWYDCVEKKLQRGWRDVPTPYIDHFAGTSGLEFEDGLAIVFPLAEFRKHYGLPPLTGNIRLTEEALRGHREKVAGFIEATWGGRKTHWEKLSGDDPFGV